MNQALEPVPELAPTVFRSRALPTEQDVRNLLGLANHLVKSRLLPTKVDTPEKAMVIMLKGAELDLPPMLALSHVHVIEGRPELSVKLASMMLSKHGIRRVWVKMTPQVATVKLMRKVDSWEIPGETTVEHIECSFTIDEAKTAGLLGKDNWRKWPAEMLSWRALGRAIDRFCPEVVGGMGVVDAEIAGIAPAARPKDDVPMKAEKPPKAKTPVKAPKKAADASEPKTPTKPKAPKKAKGAPKAAEEPVEDEVEAAAAAVNDALEGNSDEIDSDLDELLEGEEEVVEEMDLDEDEEGEEEAAEPATPAQIGKCHQGFRRLRIDDETRLAFLKGRYEVGSLKEMTADDAAALIEEMRECVRAKDTPDFIYTVAAEVIGGS